MKHTLLIALLGATVIFATPSLSFADNGYKFKNGQDHSHGKSHSKRERQHTRKHRAEHKKFVPKPPSPHRIVKKIHKDLHKKRHHNKRRHNVQKHYNNKHDYHYNEPSFSISWNVGNSTIAYGNHVPAYDYGYNNHGHKRHGAKRIYKRIHKQANRIQRGIENGQLVRREVKRLRHEQRHIKNTLAHYKRDGRLNKFERSKVNQLLDVASNNINRKSNNRLTRYTRHNHNYGYVQY